MPLISFKFVALAFLLVSIFSCGTTPTHLIVSPQVYLAPSNLLANKVVDITVVDMRTSTHIIQILEKDEAAVILSAELRLEDTIQDLLVSHWQRQGLVFTNPTENNMVVTIEKAIISVEQESVTYTTQSEIIIKVTIDNDKQTLTSSFKKRAYSDGALQADIAVLEREFNQHLSALLKQILISKDIEKFL
ncbi:YajG family lipoprotein [Colwellia piezophila]|uniref:YajG family lipoprotein n=1 Tax=Colwellia piezophila TaxID=211668 RepID=UPI00036F5EAF|nr:YajG family lipoprotein [Colwellia piezophila]